MKALGKLLSNIVWGFLLFTPIILSLIPSVSLMHFYNKDISSILTSGTAWMDIPNLFSIFGGSTTYYMKFQANEQSGDYISFITYAFDGVNTHFNVWMYSSFAFLAIAFLINLFFYKRISGAIAMLVLIISSFIMSFFFPTFFKLINPNFFMNVDPNHLFIQNSEIRYGVGIYIIWALDLLSIILATIKLTFLIRFRAKNIKLVN